MTTPSAARIVFAGGGTGGHFFPAVAIADRVSELLRGKMNAEISFIGTRRGIEYRLKDTLPYPLYTINVRGLARSLTARNILVPFILVSALVKAYLLLGRLQPDLVIGTGGYVCWPVLKAAAFRRISTLVQEQNAFPGITTRQLARKASKVYLGFEKAKEYIGTGSKTVVTGNPVRSSIADGDRLEAIEKYRLSADKKTILVLGGSQGARAVNNAVLKSLEKNKLGENYQLLWQTGTRDYKDVTARAGGKASNRSLFPFTEQMHHVYAAADLVIARAGALTMAEIAACGLPSVLIPYPHAAGDHQKKNAEDFVARGMAVMIEQESLAQVDLVGEAISLIESTRYDRMKDALRVANEGRKPAVDIIAEDVVQQLMSVKGLGD